MGMCLWQWILANYALYKEELHPLLKETCIFMIVRIRRLQWAGHVQPMENRRMAIKVFDTKGGEIINGNLEESGSIPWERTLKQFWEYGIGGDKQWIETFS